MEWTELLAMIAPAAVSLFGVMAAVIKMIHKFQDTCEDIKSDVNIKDLKNEVKVLLEQNYELRDELKELTEAISKVKK